MNYIISRHTGLIAYAKLDKYAGEHARVYDEPPFELLRSNDKVYGTLPLHLIIKMQQCGVRYFAFVSTNGRLTHELTASEHERSGSDFVEVYAKYGRMPLWARLGLSVLGKQKP